MQNRKFSRPKAVSNWIEHCLSMGSVIGGYGPVPHHPIGESAKFNKLPIGMWWIVPLTRSQHDALHKSHNDFEREYFGFSFVGRFDLEKFLYYVMWKNYQEKIGEPPVPIDVHESILAYHR